MPALPLSLSTRFQRLLGYFFKGKAENTSRVLMAGIDRNQAEIVVRGGASMNQAEITVSESASMNELAVTLRPQGFLEVGAIQENAPSATLMDESLDTLPLQAGPPEETILMESSGSITVGDAKLPEILIEFTLLKELPTEIRLLIWSKAMEDERVLEVLHFSHRGFHTDCPIPAILHVNRESRDHALKQYTPLFVDNINFHPLNYPGSSGTIAEITHYPEDNSENIGIPPFRAYVNYKRDTFYFSLGGAYGRMMLNYHMVHAFLRELPADSASKVTNIAVDVMLLCFTKFDPHPLCDLLQQNPGIKSMQLVLSDGCISHRPREYPSTPSPRRPIARIETSSDSKEILRWCSAHQGACRIHACSLESLRAIHPTDQPRTWESSIEGEMKLGKAHFTGPNTIHSQEQKEVWERLGWSYVNVIRE